MSRGPIHRHPLPPKQPSVANLISCCRNIKVTQRNCACVNNRKWEKADRRMKNRTLVSYCLLTLSLSFFAILQHDTPLSFLLFSFYFLCFSFASFRRFTFLFVYFSFLPSFVPLYSLPSLSYSPPLSSHHCRGRTAPFVYAGN